MTPPILSCRDLHCERTLWREHVSSVRGVTTAFAAHNFYAITGNPGCGHNLLVHLLGLLESPDCGNIFFENTNTTSLQTSSRDNLRQQNFGFLFPAHALLPSLTVLENIIFPALKSGIPEESEQIKHTRFALAFCELDQLATFQTSELSDEERTIVSFARAIAGRPRIIIAASPLESLALANLARKAVDEFGTTIIWAAPPKSAVLKHADHIITMSDGRLKESVI